LNVAEDTVE
jgi:hypothetical protein